MDDLIGGGHSILEELRAQRLTLKVGTLLGDREKASCFGLSNSLVLVFMF